MTRLPRASGLLVLRWVVIGCCVGVLFNSASNIVLFILNGDRVEQIQQARRDTIVITCEEQNRRHDFALTVTNRLLARPAGPQRPMTPQERAARNAAVRTWVNALVPEQDCRRRADRLLSP